MKDLKRQLKKESRFFVPDITKEIYHKVGYYKRPKTNFKLKPILSLTLFIIIAVLLFLIPTTYANSYVLVEINPAFSLEVNHKDEVVDVNPLNPDGYLLLNNTDLKNRPLKEVIMTIAELADENGYFDEEDSKMVISPVNKNKRAENKLRAKLENIIPNTIKKEIITEDEETKTYKVSPGKLFLIKKALENNPELEIADALKLDVKTLKKMLDDKAQEKITIFNNEYQKNIKSLDEIKEKAVNDLKDEKDEVLDVLDKVNKLMAKSDRNLKIIQNHLESIQSYFPNFKMKDIKTLGDCREILEELNIYIPNQYQFMEDMINDKYDLQRNLFQDNVKEKLKEKKDDISYNFDDDFRVDKYKDCHNDIEKDILKIINHLNTLMRLDNLNDKKLRKRIDALYAEYQQLIADTNETFKNSSLIQDFEETYENFKNN